MIYKTYKESYKHEAAKKVLAGWLADKYTVAVEKYFGFEPMVFKPDIATYKNDQLQAMYEVVHRCEIDGKKLGKMQYYAYSHGIDFLCHEISADWILEQTEKPEDIKKSFTFVLSFE